MLRATNIAHTSSEIRKLLTQHSKLGHSEVVRGRTDQHDRSNRQQILISFHAFFSQSDVAAATPLLRKNETVRKGHTYKKFSVSDIICIIVSQLGL